MKSKAFLILSVLFLLISCNENKDKIKIRISAVSNESDSILFSVFPENEFGQIINGAVVFVKYSSNCITFLSYNSKTCCYEGEIIPYDDSYIVTVNSNAISEIKKITIKHSVLKEKPFITFFSDSSGNSVLKGNSLDPTKEIQLCWKDLGENIIYTVSINSSTQICFQQSLYEDNIIIPPETIPESGKLFVIISAQRIFGDCTFQTCNYYSISSSKISSVMFNTKL